MIGTCSEIGGKKMQQQGAEEQHKPARTGILPVIEQVGYDENQDAACGNMQMKNAAMRPVLRFPATAFPVVAADDNGTFQSVEEDKARQRQGVDPAFGNLQVKRSRVRKDFSMRSKFRQNMHKNIPHRDTARKAEPCTARLHLQKAELADKHMYR